MARATMTSGRPSGTEISDAIGGIESPLADAYQMVRVLAILAEVRIPTSEEDGFARVLRGDAETITWAAYHAEKLMEVLEARWSEAHSLAFAAREQSGQPS